MKLIKQNRLSTLMLFLPSLFLTAQTVNTGEMVIMPNTQVGVSENLSNNASGDILNDGELFIYDNFNNEGMFDFLSQGVTFFQGNSDQQISGSSNVYFYDVVFNNSSSAVPFLLSGNINVSNSTEFNQGIIDNDTFGGSFTFLENSNYSGVFDGSHVDGRVIKIGDSSFEYPIGDASHYRSAKISAPNMNTDNFTGHYFFENSDSMNTPHSLSSGIISNINNTEYWIIERDFGNSEVLLTLSWDSNTSPDFIANANPEALHIVRWDEDQNYWVSEGGIVDVDNQTVTTISQLDKYGKFTLAVVKSEFILPDDLVIYTAVSPDSNGQNDFFFIDGIERYPNNTVKIFNRWGVEVFNTKGYNETDNVFRGYSNGNMTFNDSEVLPTGTYYYILEYEFPGSDTTPAQHVKKAGYLYITSDY